MWAYFFYVAPPLFLFEGTFLPRRHLKSKSNVAYWTSSSFAQQPQVEVCDRSFCNCYATSQNTPLLVPPQPDCVFCICFINFVALFAIDVE